MFLSIFLTFAAMAAQLSGAPTAQTEMLGIDAPDEFEIGYQARSDAMEVIELVQPPETVDTWSKLITMQLFFNAAQNGTLSSFYDHWRDMLHHSCTGMTEATVIGTVDGMSAIRATISCPRNPQTDKPENFEAVLVQGDANLMIVQVAFRRSIATTDSDLINRIITSVKVCDQRALSACSSRKATGFLPAN